MHPRGFSVSIRWQALADRSWEVETTHRGFALGEDAARFATGFGPRAAAGLFLCDAALRLVLNDGSAVELSDDDVRFWYLSRPDRAVPHPDDFVSLRVTSPALARELGGDSEFERLHCYVRDRMGRALDVHLAPNPVVRMTPPARRPPPTRSWTPGSARPAR